MPIEYTKNKLTQLLYVVAIKKCILLRWGKY